jgi:hypothetical protein
VTWTPKFSAVFEGPIIDNTLAIIERDFKAALDHFDPLDALPDFAERALGQIKKNEFPCLAIGPRDNLTEEDDDRSHVIQAARIDIYMGVVGDTAELTTRKIMKYVRAMDAVLRTARQDFFTNMSNPFGIIIEARHAYGPLGERENQYFRSAIVELTVNLRER